MGSTNDNHYTTSAGKYSRRGSNPRPPAHKTGALPLSYWSAIAKMNSGQRGTRVETGCKKLGHPRWDSNPQSSAPETDALSIWPQGRAPCTVRVPKIRGGLASQKENATTWDRTKDLSVNSRPLCQRSSGGERMNPEGIEPPTFGSGIRRAAVAPWVPACSHRGTRTHDHKIKSLALYQLS